MSSVSTSAQGGIGRRARILALGVLVACLGAFAFAGSAKAAPAPFSTSFSSGQMDLGAGFADTTILPAPNRIGTPPPLLPNLPNLWGAPAGNQPSLNLGVGAGTYDADTGDIVMPPGTFQAPIMEMENPTDGSGIPFTLRSQAPGTAMFGPQTAVTGKLDAATGELNLEGTWSIHVLVALGSMNVTSTCEFPLPGMELTSNGNQSFTGTPYENGLAGKGAVAGEFTIVDNAIEHALPPGTCNSLNPGAKGIGALWLSYGQAEPTPFPVCPEGEEGVPPNCTPIPVPTPGAVGSLKMKPGNAKVKQGKKVTLKITVTNSGEESLTQKITLKSSNKKKVKVPGSVTVTDLAGGASKTVKVKAKGKKKGKAKITAKAGGFSAKSTVKVKKK